MFRLTVAEWSRSRVFVVCGDRDLGGKSKAIVHRVTALVAKSIAREQCRACTLSRKCDVPRHARSAGNGGVPFRFFQGHDLTRSTRARDSFPEPRSSNTCSWTRGSQGNVNR